MTEKKYYKFRHLMAQRLKANLSEIFKSSKKKKKIPKMIIQVSAMTTHLILRPSL